MRAILFDGPGRPLRRVDLPEPGLQPGRVRVRVHACGVCRTDLHVVDGELPNPKLPLVLGHQIVGRVEAVGPDAEGFAIGDRIGVPWLGGSCGECRFCATGRENLCDAARYTGYQIDGGFSDCCIADPRYCFPIPERYSDLDAAPLLCAGLIGYRALRMAGDAERLGFYGFGASAHILIQIARYEGREVHVFTRPGDTDAQGFAEGLGAAWVGGSDRMPPGPLDAAIVFAPVGALVPTALRAVRPAGVVVCAGIHMSEIPAFPYSILWGERVLRSVANVTRRDGREFFALAPKVPVRTEVRSYALDEVPRALDDLREGRFTGAAAIALRAGG